MANIKNHLNNIKNALFGQEVRGSIHDGIDAINKEVESTTGRQVDLEKTFDQLVINAGNSNAEIVDARVKSDGTSYSKLGDRLNEVDSQLEHIENNIYYVTPEMFEGVDDTERIQKALKSGKNVLLTKASYRINKSLNVPKGIDLKGLNLSTIYPSTTSQINLLGDNIIEGVVIDGENDLYVGLEIHGSNIFVNNCCIKNMKFSSTVAIRTNPYHNLNEQGFIENINISNCRFDNLSCVPDGNVGDGIGVTRAIAIGMGRHINIHNNIFENLQEYEDSDYIHISAPKINNVNEYPYNELENYKFDKVYCNIYNNTFKNFKKSGIKIQASYCKIYNNTFIAEERTLMAMRGYSGEDVEFVNNTIHYNSPTETTDTEWVNSVFSFEYFKNLRINNNTIIGDCGTFDQIFYASNVYNLEIDNNVVNMPNATGRTTNSANSLCVFRLAGQNIKVSNNKIDLKGAITLYFLETSKNKKTEIDFGVLLKSNVCNIQLNYPIVTTGVGLCKNINISSYDDIIRIPSNYVSSLGAYSRIEDANIYIYNCHYEDVIFNFNRNNLEILGSFIKQCNIQDGKKSAFKDCTFASTYEHIYLVRPGVVEIINCKTNNIYWMLTSYRDYKEGDKISIINPQLNINGEYNNTKHIPSLDRVIQYSWANVPNDILMNTIFLEYNGQLEKYNYGNTNQVPKVRVPNYTKFFDIDLNRELRFNGVDWV